MSTLETLFPQFSGAMAPPCSCCCQSSPFSLHHLSAATVHFPVPSPRMVTGQLREHFLVLRMDVEKGRRQSTDRRAGRPAAILKVVYMEGRDSSYSSWSPLLGPSGIGRLLPSAAVKGCVYISNLFQSNSAVWRKILSLSPFTMWCFSSQSGFGAYKLNSLRRKRKQKLSFKSAPHAP